MIVCKPLKWVFINKLEGTNPCFESDLRHINKDVRCEGKRNTIFTCPVKILSE